MYIDRFIAGIIATLLVEWIGFVIFLVVKVGGKKK